MNTLSKNYRETYSKEDSAFAVTLETMMALDALNKGVPFSADGSGILRVANPNHDPTKNGSHSHFEINIEELKVVFTDAMRNARDVRKQKAELQNAKAFLALAMEFLVLFREFTIRNTAVWVLGSNHHHPIWVSVAELIKTYNDNYQQKINGDVKSGPRYQFISPRNTETLDTLIEKDRQHHGLAS